MNDLIDTRSKLLLGDDFNLIKNFKIVVIGLGGVGSIVPLSLVRSGVKNLLLIEKHIFIDKETDLSFLKGFDYIVDCIDDIEAKVLLAKFAINNDISLIASMGTGNRLDPSKLIITRLDKTSGDPLAKKFRYLLRKENVDLKKINVVASLEEPLVSGQVVSSMAFVPNAAGLLMSSYVIKELLRRYKDEVR